MKFRRFLLFVFALIALTIPMASQTPAGARVEFEAASIKSSRPGEPPQFMGQPGLLTTSGVQFKMLMTFAYGVRDFQITGGPSWTDSDGWSIVANFRAPTPGTRRPNDAQSPGNLMLQSLLEDRFR